MNFMYAQDLRGREISTITCFFRVCTDLQNCCCEYLEINIKINLKSFRRDDNKLASYRNTYEIAYIKLRHLSPDHIQFKFHELFVMCS